MSTFRYRMGGDGLFYEDTYPEMPTLQNAINYIRFENYYLFQPLWILLISICKSITDSSVLFQFIHSLIFNTCLYLFLKRYSSRQFSVLLVLYVSLIYFYFSFEVQREILSISIFLINIKNLEEKKWTKFYILAIISFLFHISAIVIFFLPLFGKIKFSRKLVIITLLSSLLLFFVKDNIFDLFRIFLFLESMQSKGEAYSQVSFSLIGFLAYYFVRVILFLPMALFLLTRKSEQIIRNNWFYSAFLVISVFSQFLVGFERFLNYLFVLYFVIIVDFIYTDYIYIKSKLIKLTIMMSLLGSIFFVIQYKLFTKNDFGQHYYSIFFPYNTIFDYQVNEERESYHNNSQ